MNDLTLPASPAPRPDEANSARRAQILEIAARLFALKGYKGTSMRDIGEAAGVLGGSLYHHIKSKDALFVELHNHALSSAEARIIAALAPHTDPWDRLEAAIAEMLEIQLDPESLTTPLMNDLRAVPEPVRAQLVERRDRFEDQFRALIAALPLPEGFDRAIYRIALLKMLNSATDWFRPGGLSRRELARQMFLIFRHQA